jgi:hypothetical protein
VVGLGLLFGSGALISVCAATGAWAELPVGLLAAVAAAVGLWNRGLLWKTRSEGVETRSAAKDAAAGIRAAGLGVAGGAGADAAPPGADLEYARRALLAGPGLLATFAVQNRSIAARDPLALAASSGRFDCVHLIEAVARIQQRPRDRSSREFLGGLDPDVLVCLARVLANQRLTPTDTYNAVTLFKAALGFFGSRSFKRADRLVFVEQLADLGFAQDLRRYLRLLKIDQLDPTQPALLEANAVNPFLRGAPSEDRERAWLKLVSAPLEERGFEGLRLRPGDAPAFDRLGAAPAAPVEGGPLVTVIVPTFEPGPRLATALEGLLRQSYGDLDILVMDDASPRGGPELQAWAERDPRIRVTRLAVNGGTYKARNYAVRHLARGEYVTVHDDDDWSHPRKIEQQVAYLERHPKEAADVSLMTRATDQLFFARINGNPTFTQPNVSSFMVRRSVLEEVGPWDEMNRGADSEMMDRVAAWTGHPVPAVGGVPLSFQRVREASLTDGEINRGYIDPRRLWYQAASRGWHRICVEGGGKPRLVAAGPRPFSAPVSLSAPRQHQASTGVDVLYATDFRFPGGNSSLAAREIRVLLDAGRTVGLVQIDSPLLSPAPVHPEILALSLHDRARVLSLADRAVAGLAIVRHPSVLHYLSPRRSDIEVANLVLVVNHQPQRPDGTGAVYDMSRVIANAVACFGLEPRIAPESGVIRKLLKGLVNPKLLTLADWHGLVDVSRTTPRHARPNRAPVIGRHSRDAMDKWPDANTIRAAYPLDGLRDVRVLGGARYAQESLGAAPNGWKVFPFGSRRVEEFLDELDFWVYYHSADIVESFGMAAAEAMAAGLVVVLPNYMESTFGPGAVYCEPKHSGTVIDQLWADPAGYERQSLNALRYAKQHFDRQAFLNRVGEYCAGPYST